ncbi:cell division protease ftsH [Legionella santicrucis]|uniref:Cell division protease ftsH n=1 Tax=Legionella santicrucis TaxID=45074 RepID=A0A0W0YF54_9GAMM|nr:AAA family ATPase [Legionella santicrucis]KTD55581.1 cell division protease ftsH [Legionella santicrucis]
MKSRYESGPKETINFSKKVTTQQNNEKPKKVQRDLLPTQLHVTNITNIEQAFTNSVYLSNQYQMSGKELIAELLNTKTKTTYYYPVNFDEKISEDSMGVSGPFRVEMDLVKTKDLKLDPKQIKLTPMEEYQTETLASLGIEIQSIKSPGHNGKLKIDSETLSQSLISKFKNYPLFPGQLLLVKEGEITLYLKIVQTNDPNLSDLNTGKFLSLLNENTIINITASPRVNNLVLISPKSTSLPKTFTLDFSQSGVGGLKKEISEMIRNVFMPRAMPIKMAEQYGEKHNSKGILLYGPPGTGKTLIARTIGNFFTKDKVKVISAAELMDKYVGESQRKLREIFQDAKNEWDEKGLNSQLYVYIFDEIDALAPKRGMKSDSSGVKDDMVATLLTILDGVDSPKNIIVIGTTNRLDLIDPALIRPGRLDNVIEIGLPNEEARYEILKIHTKTIAVLDSGVDLKYWAEQTTNYTGAEIEELVNKARHYAETENFLSTPGSNELTLKDNMDKVENYQKVTNEHFAKAFQDIKPMFGVDKKFAQFKKDGFVIYNSEIANIVNDCNCSMHGFNTDLITNKPLILINGESGVGKTHLAMYLAKSTGTKYIKILSPDLLLSLSLEKQINLIDEEFDNLQRAESGVLILDDLESLVGANAEYTNYNNTLRLKLISMLKNIMESDSRSIVMATSTDIDFLKRIKLYDLFNEVNQMNPITLTHSLQSRETLQQLCKSLGYNVKEDNGDQSSHNEFELILPIRDLIYQIKKFCSLEENKKTLDVNEFYHFLECKGKKRPTSLYKESITMPLFFSKRENNFTISQPEEKKYNF